MSTIELGPIMEILKNMEFRGARATGDFRLAESVHNATSLAELALYDEATLIKAQLFLYETKNIDVTDEGMECILQALLAYRESSVTPVRTEVETASNEILRVLKSIGARLADHPYQNLIIEKALGEALKKFKDK